MWNHAFHWWPFVHGRVWVHAIKQRKYEAKYGLAVALAREQVDFLFFEMDCFLLQHPLRAVKGHVVDADLYISLHQDNPFEFNVGYYFVRAGTTASGRDPLAADRAERFFTATLAYLRAHDEAFDQKLINCLMKSFSHSMDRVYHGQLSRAAVELAKDWRTEKYLQKLEALLIVADKEVTLVLTGSGDVLEPEYDVVAVGSGGNYALSAARALIDYEDDAETIGRKAMQIAADICVYTNANFTVETLDV